MNAFLAGSEAFARGMLTHLWQTTIVLVVLAGLALLVRRTSARAALALWWMALLKFFLPLAFFGPLIRRLGDALFGGVEPVTTSWPTQWIFPAPLQVSAGTPDAQPIFAVVTSLWVVGVVYIAVRGLRAVTWHSVPLPKSPDNEKQLLAALSSTRIPRKAVVVVSGRSMPAVRGFLRPIIEIPLGLIESLNPTELRPVLFHEDHHRSRRDPLLSLVPATAGALFFFFPPVHWVARRVLDATELVCDEAVLDRGVSPKEYARSIALVIASGLEPAACGTVPFIGKPLSLERRLRRLFERRNKMMNRHRIVLAAGFVCLLAGSIVPFAPGATTPLLAGSTESRSVESEGPLLAGVGDVGNPVLIPESKVDPVYPEDMREDRVEGSVILQAVIDADGVVKDVELLRSNRPEYPSLFESAREAVLQWRYEPALQKGEPVAVYFTIFVDYKLNGDKKLEEASR